MTTANVNVRQILLKKGNTARSLTYTGAIGEITLDTDLNSIRVHNGITAGGVNILATQAQIDTLSNTISTITGLDANLVANISSLLSNATSQQTTINSLIANAAIQQSNINDISSTVVDVETAVAAIFDGTATFGNLIPSANVTYNLGSPTRQWANLYISSDTIYIAGIPLRVDTGGNLTINGNSIGGGSGSGHSLVNGGAVVNLASDGKLSLPGNGDAFINTVSNTSVTLGMSTGRVNIYSGGNYFGFAANDFLLPVNGQIVFPDQTAQTTAFTGTGDIGFDDNKLFNVNDGSVVLAAAQYSGETFIVLPSNDNAATQPLTLRNMVGDVLIGTNSYGDWRFNAVDQSLSIPYGWGEGFSGNAKLSAPNGAITLTSNHGANTSSWTFGVGGQITTPQGGAIGDTYSDGHGIGLSAGPNEGDYAVINSHSGAQYVETNEEAVYIGTNWPTTNTTWAFGKDGKLTFPNGAQIEPYNVNDVALFNPSGNTVVYSNHDSNSTVELRAKGDFDQSWTFNDRGLTFPDGTVQTTAYVNNNVNMDGGGASTVYEVETAYADGGFASIRSFSETFDGNSGNNYILDGGRA